jgi:A/G-specific adenine glycosylase
MVSEFMLQQTQVARVVDRYGWFLDRFPDARACAAAPAAAVIDEWQGLGYNRRAINLHRAAQAITADHGGSVPDTLEALVSLPGVGPYTARAVLVFAYEHDVGVVDVNVARLMARWDGTERTPQARQRRADELVPVGEAWAWTQALFDLGATLCRAGEPLCGLCPVQHLCSWAGQGPDPHVRGPGQSRFEGSDRQGRGRLVDALRAGPVPPAELARAAGWPTDPVRAEAAAAGLVTDGLAVRLDDGTLALPGADGPVGKGAPSGRRR